MAFEFTRLEKNVKSRSPNLAEILNEEVAGRTWLFVSPHDDDLCIGAGLLIQAAVQSGVDVRVLVVTDGCLGYCALEQESDIVAIRRRETYDSFEQLGVTRDHIEYIDYPDGGLTPFIGRRKAQPGETAIAGYVGLQNAFTHYLRKHAPARVFVPTHTDLHPDHRITHSELMISVFHAAGAIWPELGASLKSVPRVCELAVYCDFAEPPNFQIEGDEQAFDKKLKSIEAYVSQAQIVALVESTKKAGPYEYVRDVGFKLYSPSTYRVLFRE